MKHIGVWPDCLQQPILYFYNLLWMISSDTFYEWLLLSWVSSTPSKYKNVRGLDVLQADTQSWKDRSGNVCTRLLNHLNDKVLLLICMYGTPYLTLSSELRANKSSAYLSNLIKCLYVKLDRLAVVIYICTQDDAFCSCLISSTVCHFESKGFAY